MLNASSAILIVAGYRAVRRGDLARHRRAMLSACGTSTLFLLSYLAYHAVAGSTRFTGTGWIRPVYFGILLSHTVLAVVILPLVILSVWNGLKNRVEQHRRVARWTFPLWLYVSLTGVLVYLFLYQLYPSRTGV